MDAIDLMLISDKRYLPMLEAQEAEITTTSIEELEANYVPTCYPESTSTMEEEDFEAGDYIDQEAYDTLDALENDEDGEIIDFVSGMED